MNYLRALLGVGVLTVAFSISLAGQRLSGDHYLAADVANDVFYLPLKTDRYFTSGLRVEYGSLRRGKPTLGESTNSTTRQYWQLRQHIYTPENIESAVIVIDDRPFASYLVLSRGKEYCEELLGFDLLNEWTAGILGKYSGGGRMQNAFHDMVEFAERIPGWVHEVKPDLILNYRLQLIRSFKYGRRLRLNPRAAARLGSLHTDASAGLTASLIALQLNPDRQLRLELSGDVRLVGYNATLSGGLFNRDDRYRGVVRPHRLVGRGSLDAFVDYDGWQLRGGVTTLSSEFDGGKPHIWAWFGLRTGN